MDLVDRPLPADQALLDDLGQVPGDQVGTRLGPLVGSAADPDGQAVVLLDLPFHHRPALADRGGVVDGHHLVGAVRLPRDVARPLPEGTPLRIGGRAEVYQQLAQDVGRAV
jgi:hypothetical protein